MPAPFRSTRPNERAQRYRKGVRAERVAALRLQLSGWRIMARRYKTPLGEIDLIACRGKTIAFIEVKARKHSQDAAHAVHIQNQQRVVRAAQWFLSAHPKYAEWSIRFDACLIPWYGWPIILPHAFGESL